MSKKAMKLALEALEESLGYVEEEAENAQRLYGQYPTRQARIQGLKDGVRKHMHAITALRQALEQQPADEPVAWGIANTRPTERNPLMMVMLDEPAPSHLVVPLYTRPQPAAWVGLTNEEIEKEWVKMCGPQSWARHKVYARTIEAKLKEKNT